MSPIPLFRSRAQRSGELVLYDSQSGQRLLTEAESERAAREAAEAELERLREELRRQGLPE